MNNDHSEVEEAPFPALCFGFFLVVVVIVGSKS